MWSDLQVQHKRYVTHVNHLKLLYQLAADFLYQLDITSNHNKLIHIEREDDDDPVMVVDVGACIRFKRNKSD